MKINSNNLMGISKIVLRPVLDSFDRYLQKQNTTYKNKNYAYFYIGITQGHITNFANLPHKGKEDKENLINVDFFVGVVGAEKLYWRGTII